MELKNNKIRKVIDNVIDLPSHKLIYIIRNKVYVLGIWRSINRYGIPFSKKNHEILVVAVQDKLEGGEMEREWTQEEYKNFVLYEPTEEVK